MIFLSLFFLFFFALSLVCVYIYFTYKFSSVSFHSLCVCVKGSRITLYALHLLLGMFHNRPRAWEKKKLCIVGVCYRFLFSFSSSSSSYSRLSKKGYVYTAHLLCGSLVCLVVLLNVISLNILQVYTPWKDTYFFFLSFFLCVLCVL